MDTKTTFDCYKTYLEQLTVDGLPSLGEFVAENVVFRDPLHEVHGLSAMRAVLARMFETVSDVVFVVDSHAVDGDAVFFRWTLTGVLGGKPWSVEGVTRLTFDRAGKVLRQEEYWDAASQLFSRFPVIGPLLKWFRRKAAGNQRQPESPRIW